MRSLAWLAAVLGLAASLAAACSDDKKPDWENDTDTDTDTGSETDTDTDTETDTDTGEDETPPALPASCQAVTVNTFVSGDGDGAIPALALSEGGLVAWGYDPQEDGADAQWRIQIAAYDPGTGPGATADPMSDTVIARKPSAAHRDGAYGVSWLDSRWDGTCSSEDQESCAMDIAFMTFDATGVPTNTIPLRVTNSGSPETGPLLEPTADGWLVAWGVSAAGETLTAWAVPLDPTGNPGTAVQVSGEGVIDDDSGLDLAVSGDTAVLVWADEDQHEILAAALNLDGTAKGDPVPIDSGDLMITPTVAGKDDGFMVAFSKRPNDDFEIYTMPLEADGTPADGAEPARASWTTSNAMSSKLAWSGTTWGMAWLSNRNNGEADCLEDGCESQVLFCELDEGGAPATRSVVLSTDPNPSFDEDLAWDGSGWTAAWALRQNMRDQIVYGRATCADKKSAH